MEPNISVQRKWLIKSSTKIVGPFTIDELIVELGAKNVSLIDEIRDPQTRWKFIREHPLLEEVVRRLRELQAQQSEDTGTQSSGTVTMEKEDTTTIIHADSSSPASVAIPLKSPQFEKNLMRQGEHERTSVWPWIAGVAVMVVSLSFFYWKSQQKGGTPSLTNQDRVQIAYALGDSPRVIELFEAGAQESKYFNKQQAVRSYLKAEVFGSYFEKTWSSVSANPPEKEIWPFDQALYATLTKDLPKAREIYKSQLSQGKAMAAAAEINLALLNFEEANYQKAYDEADSLLRKGVTDPILLLAKATALIFLSDTGNTDDRIRRSLDDLQRYESLYVEYSQEAILLRGFLKFRQKDIESGVRALKQLIEQVPQVSNRHETDSRISNRFLTHHLLNFVSSELSNKAIAKSLKEGVYLWIGLQRNDRAGIKENVFRNYNLFIEDPTVSPLLSYALMVQGDLGRSASVLSGSIPETSLSLYMGSMTCFRKDELKCAETLAGKAISRNSKDVSSISLLARIKSHDGQISETQALLRQGRFTSPSFSEWALIERGFEW